MNPIRFGSVCSGIEAASVAWHPLGWRAAWLAEIEPFPSAVLKHHYPDVTNLGDMMALPGRIASGEIEAPDVFCGGTPCQAFSVAGLRKSLDDARGNLALTFCEIANAIDTVRTERGEQPAIIFWENVPGVLNTKDNAFGCFLGALAGEDDPLVAPGGKWTNAGCVYGPQRAVAWRVLDAQYFGVAQRRRRVFVVASARTDFDPAAVLFEFDGVRRDTAPSREAGKEPAAGTLRSTDGGCDFDHIRAGHAVAFGGNNQSGPIDVATARNACASASGRMDFETETFLVQPTHTLRGEGFDDSEDGTGRGTPLVPVAFHPLQDPISSTDGTTHAIGCGSSGGQASVAIAFSSKDYGADATTELAPTLCAMNHADSHANGGGQMAVAFAENSRAEIRLEGGDGQRTGAISTGGGKPGQGVPMIAFPANLSGTQCASTEELAPSMGAKNPTGVAYTTKLHNTASNQAGKFYENYSTSLDANSPPPAVVFQQTAECLTAAYGTKWNGNASADNGSLFASHAMQVRRLTPVECERLQGFPDGYTQIPWRKKPASECPDGPRYKALGNSWAVPNVNWIGRRIDAHLRALSGAEIEPGEAA